MQLSLAEPRPPEPRPPAEGIVGKGPDHQVSTQWGLAGGLPGRVAEDYESARRKAKGECIVCRSPLHVVSHLVNNGCLLTRMRRLNNAGGRLNTVPHQDAASSAAHRPGREPPAGWSLEDGGNQQPARSPGIEGRSVLPFQGVPIRSAQAQPLVVLHRKTIKEPAPVTCGCQTLEVRNGGLGLNPGPLFEEALSAASQAFQCHASGK